MRMSLLDDDTISFQSEGRLLQELGERLVASPEVALVELIKNSYDADSAECKVSLTDTTLTIKDLGHGMNVHDFKNKWMKIASGAKEEEEYSPKYSRKLTGAKGIGRFAVRFLGKHLVLDTRAYDPVEKCFTRLKATFDWILFDSQKDLGDVKVPYQLYKLADGDQQSGTTLTITKLREVGQLITKDVRTEILKIVKPVSGLDRGHFTYKNDKSAIDPGFKVLLPSDSKDDNSGEANLAEDILNNYWAKLVVALEPANSVKDKNLTYKIFFAGETEPCFVHEQKYKTTIQSGLFADVRFFPRRGGIFSGKGFNGFKAWEWVYENCGISIVDHGFRIKPYGYKEDDWLMLAKDRDVNSRDWRSLIMQEHYPIPQEKKESPKHNPMLYLPGNHQMVGAVFVESGHTKSPTGNYDLIPSSDREGYLNNTAFRSMAAIVRTGIEMLALADKTNEEHKEKEAARRAFEAAREDIKDALGIIQSSTTLIAEDKFRLIAEYSRLADNIEEAEAYSQRARQSLETMSLLGVVAGFMTHENKRILFDLKKVINSLTALATKYPEVTDSILPLETSYNELHNQLEYSSMFIGAVQTNMTASFSAKAQIDHIIDRFGHHAQSRGIFVRNELEEDVYTPKIPIAIYSGVVLNLFTNALKAVIADASPSKERVICFRGWNQKNKHIIEVLDTGIGIPPSIRKRIWDPLFTTTSNLNNPFGSGMGLGLNLIRKLMVDIGGSISLIDAPPQFTTCFKVELPL